MSILAKMRSRAAVLEALSEFDRLGRDGFLHRYGYGKRTRYALVHKGTTTTRKRSLG